MYVFGRDWCLSRQLWWGHRLPMWRVQGVSSSIKEDVDGNGKECIIDDSGDLWVFGRDESEAMSTAIRIFKGIDGQENISLIRDEDVLDTWFSSSLLPFANFQWPTPTKDFAKFYPLSIMETGHDILFFWVARMVMVAHIVMKDLPFKVCLSFNLFSACRLIDFCSSSPTAAGSYAPRYDL